MVCFDSKLSHEEPPHSDEDTQRLTPFAEGAAAWATTSRSTPAPAVATPLPVSASTAGLSRLSREKAPVLAGWDISKPSQGSSRTKSRTSPDLSSYLNVLDQFLQKYHKWLDSFESRDISAKKHKNECILVFASIETNKILDKNVCPILPVIKVYLAVFFMISLTSELF